MIVFNSFLILLLFIQYHHRLASTAKNTKAATAAAKTYFTDLNDMYEGAVKKNAATVNAAYQKSLKDLATFKTTIASK